MKTKMLLHMIFMLLVFTTTQVFAQNSPPQNEAMPWTEEKAYFDTVIVVDSYKDPVLANSLDKNGVYYDKIIGEKITLVFSNGLLYDYPLYYHLVPKEMTEKGIHSVYYVKNGDVVVVKVDISYGYERVVELVRNLKFY